METHLLGLGNFVVLCLRQFPSPFLLCSSFLTLQLLKFQSSLTNALYQVLLCSKLSPNLVAETTTYLAEDSGGQYFGLGLAGQPSQSWLGSFMRSPPCPTPPGQLLGLLVIGCIR